MDLITIIIIIATVAVLFAIAIIWLLKSRKSVNSDILYSDALNAILRGENSEAIKLLKLVVSKDSDNIGAYLQLGNILRSTNPQQSAKIHQSLTVRPKLNKSFIKEIHQALALDYAEIKDFKRAKIEADMVFKFDKNSIWANQFLLNIAEKQNDWDRAIELATKIQKFNGNVDKRYLAEIRNNAGVFHLEDGQNKKALQYLQKSIKIDPTFAAPYAHIGNIYEEEKNLKKAIINWEKNLINSKATNSEVYQKIESALFELGRFGETEQLYQNVLTNIPNDKNTITKYINMLIDKNDIESAIAKVDDFIKNENGSIPARLMKIKVLLEKANPIDLKKQIDDLVKII